MADFLYRTLGAVTYPILGTDVANEQLYSVVDPVRAIMLGTFAAAVNYELAYSTSAVDATSPWGIARVGTSLASAMPVADTYYESLDKETMRKVDIALPVMALYRTDGEISEETLQLEKDTCRWTLDYVMGPLKEEDKRRLGATLKSVRDIVLLTIRNRGHSAYQSGALQFGTGAGDLLSLRAVSYQMGAAEFGERGEGMIFHALSMTLETEEVDGLVTTANPEFDGASLTLGVGGGDDGVAHDVIEVRTEVALQPSQIQSPELL